ncbi:MAG: T9SS type A sorting domain-containing protein [Bacteroidales bacterium]|nr:T9SS type A sorting domain-containing protein [Bacteroidales bacterium]
MKRFAIILLIGIIFVLPIMSFAQEKENEEGWFRCGTDSVYDELVKRDPQVALNRAKLNDFVREYIKQNPRSNDDEVYVIPVVFHVLHEYGYENISYEAIQAAIEQMNKDYRKMRDDTASIKEEFKPIAADTKIEFRLARKDPDGNCTMGVTRTYSMLTNSGDEQAKEVGGMWDNTKYLNVWTVKSMSESGVAGYSYYPGTAPDGGDGIILLYDYIGRALTHEAGHYLNLPHPWGGTNEPGQADNCDIDDGIDDTPNTVGHTSCNLNSVTCGSLDNVQNFMDYSYCYRMFTNGQAAVMRATLNSSVAGRNNLCSAQNRVATGTDDDYIEEECTPIVDFVQSKKMVCAGATVSYNDLTYNTTSVGYRLWTFEGGEPATSGEENPSVVYNEGGRYSTELYVENSADGVSLNKEGNLMVYDKLEGYELPYTEQFETSTFPLISGNSANDFYVENYNPDINDNEGWWVPKNESWTQVDVGYTGKSVRIRNSRVGTKKNKLYLPNIVIENDSVPLEVSFKVAAAGKSSDSYTDILYFYYSNSCGDTLRMGHSFSGSRMITSYENFPMRFVPSQDEWTEHSFTIPASSLKGKNFRLVIMAENRFGNTIYIDDLTYSQNAPTNIGTETVTMSAYPNPFYDNLMLDVDDMNGEYTVEAYDMMGRMLFSGRFAEQHVDLGNAFANEVDGVYFLKVYSGEDCRTIKVVKER